KAVACRVVPDHRPAAPGRANLTPEPEDADLRGDDRRSGRLHRAVGRTLADRREDGVVLGRGRRALRIYLPGRSRRLTTTRGPTADRIGRANLTQGGAP